MHSFIRPGCCGRRFASCRFITHGRLENNTVLFPYLSIWLDPGDYGKYFINAGHSVAFMLLAGLTEPDAIDIVIDPIANKPAEVPDWLRVADAQLNWQNKTQRDDGAFYCRGMTRQWLSMSVSPEELRLRCDVIAAGGLVFIHPMITTTFTFAALSIGSLTATEVFLCYWQAGQAEIAVLIPAVRANILTVMVNHLTRSLFSL